MITIKKATLEDFDTLAEIWEASVRATHDFLTDAHINVLNKPQVREVYMPHMPRMFCYRSRYFFTGRQG